MTKAATPPTVVTTETLLRALLALHIDEREHRLKAGDSEQLKTELLLAACGLSYQDIAALMGKSPDAVRMMLARQRQTAKKGA